MSHTWSEDELARALKQYWLNGRSIIPIIGAGASADSGFPALASIVRYVAKLSFYLREAMYLPNVEARDLVQDAADQFSSRPDVYISAFGWPDRFQLNAEILNRIEERDQSDFRTPLFQKEGAQLSGTPNGAMDNALRVTLDDLAAKINPGATWHLDKYLSKIDTVRQKIKQESDPRFSALVEELALPKTPLSFRYQVAGDWKPLLRYITWYQPELIDALFGRLARQRQPGTAHIVLAHLTQLLRIHQIFTFNFDPFIEDGLTSEHVQHRVFAMEHGGELPSRHHLDETVAVIKMHGSTHNILVDERVDYRISDRYRNSFLELIGPQPVLWVMGCSGSDRRLVDLISDVMEDVPAAEVIWMHHAKNDDVPAAFSDAVPSSAHKAHRIPKTLRDRFHKAHTYDLGLTLQHVFVRLTDRLPNASSPYTAHIMCPVISPPPNWRNSEEEKKRPFPEVIEHAVSCFGPARGLPPGHLPWLSRDYLYALARVPLGYSTIWVDLEEHHSLEQVVSEIIDQIRRGDTALPPIILPEADDPRSAERAAERVFFALQRSRYVLCISGLDAFPFRATTHHGVTRVFEPKDKHRFQLLFEFLKSLTVAISRSWSNGDSCIVLHWEHPYARHTWGSEEPKSVAAVEEIMKACLSEISKAAVSTDSTPPFRHDRQKHITFEAPLAADDKRLLYSEHRLVRGKSSRYHKNIGGFFERVAWAAIAAHRRTRTHFGIQQLFHTLWPDQRGAHFGASFLRALKQLPHTHWITWTNGSGLWCDRPARDFIYDFNTRFLSDERLRNPQDHANAQCQALMAAFLHDRIAMNYYQNLFLPSRDPFLYLEYLYHRISMLRYMSMLLVVSRWLKGTSHSAAIHRKRLLKFKRSMLSQGAKGTRQSTVVGDVNSSTAEWAGHTHWGTLVDCLLEDGDSIAKTEILINRIRERSSHGMMASWKRTEAYLRNKLPSMQVIGLCDNIERYNLGGKRLLTTKYDSNIADDVISDLLNQFTLDVRNSRLKALYAQGRFDDMQKAVALEQVTSNVPQLLEQSACSDVPPKNIHEILTYIVAEMWKVASSGTASKSVTVIKALKEVAHALRNSDNWRRCEPEARLRVYYMESEAVLGSFSILRELLPSKDNDYKEWLSNLETLQRHLGVAMEDARDEYPTNNERLQNPFLEQTIDKGLFMPYRALFHLQLGRCYLARARVLSSQARSVANVPGKPQKLLEDTVIACRNAFRSFAYARNGIGPENSIILAIADLCSAEVALRQSDAIYGSSFRLRWDSGARMMNKVRAKLHSSSGYLLRCWHRLRDGPRFVLLWRFFHITQVEYHLRRIFASLGELIVKQQTVKTSIDRQVVTQVSGDLARRVRLGLTGIRFGLDFSPESQASVFRGRLIELWSELGAAALATSICLCEMSMPPIKAFMRTPLSTMLFSAWVDMNCSEGIFLNLSARKTEEKQKLKSDFVECFITDKGMRDDVEKLRIRLESVEDIASFVKLQDGIRENVAARFRDIHRRQLGKDRQAFEFRG